MGAAGACCIFGATGTGARFGACLRLVLLLPKLKPSPLLPNDGMLKLEPLPFQGIFMLLPLLRLLLLLHGMLELFQGILELLPLRLLLLPHGMLELFQGILELLP